MNRQILIVTIISLVGNSLNLETNVKNKHNYFFKVMMGILGYCSNNVAQISSIKCPSTVTIRFARKDFGSGKYNCGVNHDHSYCPSLQKPFCAPDGYCYSAYEFKNLYHVYPEIPKDRTIGRRLLSVDKLVSNNNQNTFNFNKKRTLSNDKNSLRFLQTFTPEGLRAQRESAKKINGTKTPSDPQKNPNFRYSTYYLPEECNISVNKPKKTFEATANCDDMGFYKGIETMSSGIDNFNIVQLRLYYKGSISSQKSFKELHLTNKDRDTMHYQLCQATPDFMNALKFGKEDVDQKLKRYDALESAMISNTRSFADDIQSYANKNYNKASTAQKEKIDLDKWTVKVLISTIKQYSDDQEKTMNKFFKINNSIADVKGKIAIQDLYENKFSFFNLDKSWLAIQKLYFMRQNRRKLQKEKRELEKKSSTMIGNIFELKNKLKNDKKNLTNAYYWPDKEMFVDVQAIETNMLKQDNIYMEEYTQKTQELEKWRKQRYEDFQTGLAYLQMTFFGFNSNLGACNLFSTKYKANLLRKNGFSN